MVKAEKQIQLSQKPAKVSQQDATSSVPSALKYQSIKEVSKRFFLGRADVKHLFGISESTQFRYEKQNPVLKSAIADRLERFNRRLWSYLKMRPKHALAVYPKVTLGGQTPLSALH